MKTLKNRINSLLGFRCVSSISFSRDFAECYVVKIVLDNKHITEEKLILLLNKTFTKDNVRFIISSNDGINSICHTRLSEITQIVIEFFKEKNYISL